LVVLAMAKFEPPTGADATATARLDATIRSLKPHMSAKIDLRVAVDDLLYAKGFECLGLQEHAKAVLRKLYTDEETHRSEFDTYGSIDEVGLPVPHPLWRIEVLAAGATTFRARATGLGKMAGEVWETNEQNNLRSTRSLCTDSLKIESLRDSSRGSEIGVALFRRTVSNQVLKVSPKRDARPLSDEQTMALTTVLQLRGAETRTELLQTYDDALALAVVAMTGFNVADLLLSSSRPWPIVAAELDKQNGVMRLRETMARLRAPSLTIDR
jgi:hypothetical protein